MGFLAALVPALLSGAASAGAGALVSGALGGNSKHKAQENINRVEGVNQTGYGNSLDQMIGNGGNQYGDAQNQFIQALAGQMGGGGPSVAQNQLSQALDVNQRQAAGQIANIRGLNPATAARLALQNQAAQSQQAAGQAATMRAQEQLAQQGLLGQTISQAQSADTQRLATLGQLQNQQNEIAGNFAQAGNKTNAGTAAGNAENNSKIAGGVISGTSAGLANALGGRKMFQAGGVVPGKAHVQGDSPMNDKVPAMLSPGEIVIPRSKTDPDDAKEFVKAVKAQGKGGKKKELSYGEVLKAHHELQERVAQLESFACGGMVQGYAEGGMAKKDSPVSKEEADRFNTSLQNAFGYGTYLNQKKKKA
jgi:hypothetical protein